MNKKTTLLLIVCLNLFLSASLSACGKYGDPVPRQAERSFTWETVDISPASAVVASCLDIRAQITGKYTNLDSVILELSGADSAEACSNCPFRPTEKYTLQNLSQVFDRQSGNLQFSYCPNKQSKTYRARLIGTNIYNTANKTVSPEHTIVMP